MTIRPAVLGRSENLVRESDALPDERSLVQRAREDRDAFAEIYVRYAPRIFGYLRSRTTTADEAADLTQQVFARALGAIARYREGEAPFSAWLFRIAMNAATDMSRRRRPTVPLEAVTDLIAASADPQERAALSDDLRRLRLLVGQLSVSDRDLLALRFAGGLTSKEIAPLVHRSEEAVKKQLWRILRALKEQYHDHDDKSR